MVDQMRQDQRKSKGFPLDTMPFLDSLSEKGLEFDRAYTANPTCMPARVSLFTGRYPSCHNVRTNHNAQDAVYTKDLMEVLHEAGYLTALCGKNHSHMDKDDFDVWEETSHLGNETIPDETETDKAFDAFLKTTRFCDSMEPSPYGVEAQLPYRNVSSCLRFVDRAVEEKKPFFCWLSMAEPHNPYQVPYPYFDLFKIEDLPPVTTTEEDIRGKDPKYQFMHDVWQRVYKEKHEERVLRDRSNYLGMLRLIDDQLKRLYDGLMERKLMEDTLLVFVSDHGEFIGEYDIIRKGCGVSEILSHIPMVFVGAGVERNGHEEEAFSNIVDLFPTFCDLIDEPVPFGVQGKSLLPILQGKPYPKKDFSIGYSETGFGGLYWDRQDALTDEDEGATDDWTRYDCLNTWTQAGAEKMVRKEDYELIVDMMGSHWLYNVKEDPLEVKDLAKDPAFASILLDLSLEMNAITMRLTDPIPSCCRRYRTKVHPKGFYFDENFHVEKDPGVVYHKVLTPKRKNNEQ